jgi:hypothetical protein
LRPLQCWKKGATVKCKKDLVLLWSQQFAEEFSNQVLPLTADQLQLCIADRRQATHAVDNVAGTSYVDQSALPATVEEWIDLFAITAP